MQNSGSPEDIRPFEINVGSEAIDDLRHRLGHVRWPEIPFDTGWLAGTNDGVLRELADYWPDDYDWAGVENRLNTLPHFETTIEGERIHFLHYQRTDAGQRPPILLLHGWPGSFNEFVEGAGLISGFNLVVPSLPGFVFSDPPSSPGMHTGRISQRLHELMRRLGYAEYGIQGGDWGSAIGMEMARTFPDAVRGLHLNFCAESPPPGEGETVSDAEREYRDRVAAFRADELAYFEIQRTRPQTLVYGLQDSPVGLLSWMLEKFWAWSDHGDSVDAIWDTFSRDQLLTNVSLYWFSGSILSSARIYYENTHRSAEERAPQGRITVPTGFAHFPREPWGPPREVMDRVANLVRYSEMARGGHFAALEQPELWAEDVEAFFSSL